jgi:nitrogen-specific signal transduction histidine kinase/CheY-like chemotaxis protein
LSFERLGEQRLRDLNETLEERVALASQNRIKAEDQLRQSQKMEAVGQLTGGVAHDFNNLLTVIGGAAEMLSRPDLAEDKRQRYLDAITETAGRATKLTGQLLAFARRQALKPEVFPVGENVRAVSEMIATLIGSRVHLEVVAPEEPLYIHVDPSQFDTALVNMAVNARDAMDGEGRLTITIAQTQGIPAVRAHPALQGDYVAVSITDTGTGVAPEQLDRIFEPFFTTKEVGQGTGLGLSQVFGFAKQSGGEVIAQGGTGSGAVFTLYLPQIDPIRFTRHVVDEVRVPPIGRRARVLVVEDNPDVGQFATHALNELGHFTVLAIDARQALDELKRDAGRFDVIFSDVVMPGMSGVELAQEVRRLYPDLPIVLASGYSHVLAEDSHHGFELIHKPYSMDELSRVLRNVFEH